MSFFQESPSPGIPPDLWDYKLTVVQQPENGRVSMGKEKDRKALDPPPILQLRVSREQDPQERHLQSPYLLVTVRLWRVVNGLNGTTHLEETPNNALVGTLVSSLNNLKDGNNQQGAFFIFGDLSCRTEGLFQLEFILRRLDFAKQECVQCARVMSNTFEVYSHKLFPGMAESTFLTRLFSDQGMKLRVRKASRQLNTRKHNEIVGRKVESRRGELLAQQHRVHASQHGSPHQVQHPAAGLAMVTSMASQHQGLRVPTSLAPPISMAHSPGMMGYGNHFFHADAYSSGMASNKRKLEHESPYATKRRHPIDDDQEDVIDSQGFQSAPSFWSPS